jgi:hypothetical protein
MEITKETVQKRLQALIQKRDELTANVNAYNGAIEDCQYWLGEIQKAEDTNKPEPEKKYVAELLP